MSLTNTKSLLAKLLASENLTVEHGNYPTASMDVKNRVLRLPIWKEMSGSLYDLMVLHEVGHALYTPEDGWHESASKKGNGYKSFLNVVEDARIERKIKDKYPGGRRSFTEGYLDLTKKDFFGLRGVDLEELNLIDRINLHFKGGTLHDISFSDEENEFVEKVRNTVTWADVVRVTDELYEYAKDHDSETDMSDHDSFEWVEGDEDEDEETSDDENEMNSGEGSDNMSEDELKEMMENFEAGEEEKEDSGSSCAGGEGEGETEEEGRSAGDGGKAKDGEEGDKSKAGSGNSDGEGEKDSNSMGSGAGVGSPSDETHVPRSMTDENFRSRESELVTTNEHSSMTYVNLPVANLDNIIIDHKEIHKEIFDHYNVSGEDYIRGGGTHDRTTEIKDAGKDFVEFRNRNKKTVEYLAKEFEMKKAADAHSRTATANSGIIDTGMLHTYKYNEHIFRKINVTADGKNHGLVMVVDWSGSMSRNIKGTIEQMMVLVMFAKRVNIPFEVFLFSDSYGSEFMHGGKYNDEGWTHKDDGKHGDIVVDKHHLLNVFSSRMRANELHTAYINMTAIANAYDRNYNDYYSSSYKTLPSNLSLGGTPLNASLLAINTFVPEFKAKNGVQIVNLIYLTDGESSGGHSVWNRLGGNTSNRFGRGYGSSEKVILRDTVTKREYTVEQTGHLGFSRGSMTNALVEVLRDKHSCNVVNFYIVDRFKNYDAAEFANADIPPQVILSKFRKEGHLIAENYGGWTELYLLKGGKDLGVEESILTVKEDAKRGEIKRAFSKFNKGKLKNRVLLSKFVDMVAA